MAEWFGHSRVDLYRWARTSWQSSLPCSLLPPLVRLSLFTPLWRSSVLTLNNGIASRRQSLCIIHLALLYIPSCSPFSKPFSAFILIIFVAFFFLSGISSFLLLGSFSSLFFHLPLPLACFPRERENKSGMERSFKAALQTPPFETLFLWSPTPPRARPSNIDRSNFTAISSRFGGLLHVSEW